MEEGVPRRKDLEQEKYGEEAKRDIRSERHHTTDQYMYMIFKRNALPHRKNSHTKYHDNRPTHKDSISLLKTVISAGKILK